MVMDNGFGRIFCSKDWSIFRNWIKKGNYAQHYAARYLIENFCTPLLTTFTINSDVAIYLKTYI